MFGLTARESEIEALYDAGTPSKEIARRLQLTRRYVDLVIFRLGLNDNGRNPHEAAVRMGTAALLRALQREGFA